MPAANSASVETQPGSVRADVVVYGDSPAALTAALHLAKNQRDVLLVCPVAHVGGMMIEGLGHQDIDGRSGDGVSIGGLAREFYLRVARAYDPGTSTPRYRFEAKVAHRVIDEWLDELGVRQLRGRPLAESPDAVVKEGTRITTLRLADGTPVAGRVFIDGTVEGDLLARAGVSYTWEREGNARYGETVNGILNPTTKDQFTRRIDPYVVPGDPSSGLIPGVQPEPMGRAGDPHPGVMAYCLRLPLTKDPANKIPIGPPENYDPAAYELYRRYFAAGGMNDWLDGPGDRNPSTTTKLFDLGSWHDLCANLYGRNHDYPDGSAAVREAIYREHRSFTQGLIHYLSTHPDVPPDVRQEWSRWGLCADEFTDNGGWPRRLYVRAARRMISDYVVTEADVRRHPVGDLQPAAPVPDPVAIAYWPIDFHNARTIVHDGAVTNEGALFDRSNYRPMGIAYRAIVPRRAECTNLLVPAALSSSYVGYSAVRLEWTFMILGESAAAAAALCVEQGVAVQDVAYADLRPRLLAAGQILALEPRPTAP